VNSEIAELRNLWIFSLGVLETVTDSFEKKIMHRKISTSYCHSNFLIYFSLVLEQIYLM
jgi:hypothetical protein